MLKPVKVESSGTFLLQRIYPFNSIFVYLFLNQQLAMMGMSIMTKMTKVQSDAFF